MPEKYNYPLKNIYIILLTSIVYALLAFYAFPTFSVSVMLFSVALAMLGAWFFGFPGALIIIILCVPYHHFLITYYSDDPATWNEKATNPFGISTQLIASYSVTLLRRSRIKLEQTNLILEKKVYDRTNELRHLQEYLIKNHENLRILLSRILLEDTGDLLLNIKKKCETLEMCLARDRNSSWIEVRKLNEMIQKSIHVVNDLEVVDQDYEDNHIQYSKLLHKIIRYLEETSEILFSLNLHSAADNIPQHIQHQLFHITQEAITNAVRHGKASWIQIDLNLDLNNYRLVVTNDGRRLPMKIKSGLGLNLMQRRTEELGGNLTLRTTADDTTELCCTIPRANN